MMQSAVVARADRAAAVAMTLVAFLAAACSLYPAAGASLTPTASPSPTSVGLTADDAATIALANAGSAARSVEWVDSGPLNRFVDPQSVPSEDQDRMVWAVGLAGAWAVSCPPTTPRRPCSPDMTHALVILDFETGVFIMLSAHS